MQKRPFIAAGLARLPATTRAASGVCNASLHTGTSRHAAPDPQSAQPDRGQPPGAPMAVYAWSGRVAQL